MVKGQHRSHCRANREEEGKKKERKKDLRWMGDVGLDWRNMGGERWRTRTLDRTEWTSVVREGKTKLKGF
jgi:hypothetical protein